MWLKSRLCVFISIHLSVLFFLVSFYLVLKSFFHLFLNPAMVPDEFSIEDPLCNSSLGSMVTLDHVTPDTGYEPKEMELADADELNLATTNDIHFQNALEDTASFPNDPDVDDNELAEFPAIVVDGMGQPVEVRSNSDHFSCDIRNVQSAQSQFPSITQPKRMVNQTGGGGVCSRKSRLEQRRMIIAEHCEKIGHHELPAAHAEEAPNSTHLAPNFRNILRRTESNSFFEGPHDLPAQPLRCQKTDQAPWMTRTIAIEPETNVKNFLSHTDRHWNELGRNTTVVRA